MLLSRPDAASGCSLSSAIQAAVAAQRGFGFEVERLHLVVTIMKSHCYWNTIPDSTNLEIHWSTYWTASISLPFFSWRYYGLAWILTLDVMCVKSILCASFVYTLRYMCIFFKIIIIIIMCVHLYQETNFSVLAWMFSVIAQFFSFGCVHCSDYAPVVLAVSVRSWTI